MQQTLTASLFAPAVLSGAQRAAQQRVGPLRFFEDASWPKAPANEWCPPGHGDLYPALVGSGTLDKLLAKGFKYMFVSNSDNLGAARRQPGRAPPTLAFTRARRVAVGATMDLTLLTWFAQSGAPFAMEVAARTDSDKKGEV